MTNRTPSPIRVLLTVPHLMQTASPYREMMALARHLPGREFVLTVCSLRSDGFDATGPLLTSLGASVFVARFRPRGWKSGHLASVLEDQDLIDDRGPYDVQHSMDFSSLPVEAVLARIRGRRFMLSQRNLNPGGHGTLLRMKSAFANCIVAISSATREMLEAKGVSRRKIVEVRLGIDADVLRDAAPSDPAKKFVLSVGQVMPLKRHQDGIRAFARVSARFPDLEFLIAGQIVDPAYADSLRSLARSLALENRIHMLGVRTDILELMRAAVCLLHCAESEALGWVILEAMAAGLPVVASAVGGIKEIVRHQRNGVLVSVGDVDSFAGAIRHMLEAPAAARSLAAEGLVDVAGKYSARKMVNELADVYRQVCVDTVAFPAEKLG